jgi:capsular exopolysaccharide synthesis family protein
MSSGKEKGIPYPIDRREEQVIYVSHPGIPLTQIGRGPADEVEEEAIDLRTYWQILKKRKWIILSVFTVIVLTTLIVSFMLRPTYQGEAVIQINPENPKVLDFKELLGVNRRSLDFYRTQHQKLYSRSLALRSAERLRLHSHPEYSNDDADKTPFARLTQGLISLLKAVFPSQESEDKGDGLLTKAEKKEHMLVTSFLNNVEIAPKKRSRLVSIKFNAHDPKLAGKAPNTIADEFIRINLEQRFSMATQAKEWLNKQLDVLKAKVERSEEGVRKFGRKHGIVSLDEKEENIVIQKLSDINKELTKAQADRIAIEAKYNQAKGRDFQTLPAVLENELIRKLKADYIGIEGEYETLAQIYKPDYPDMKQLEKKMVKIKTRLNQEISRIVGGLKAQYEAASKREDLLQRQLESQKKEAMRVKELAIQYNILKREADTNTELYNGLLQRMKETGLEAGLQSSNVQIIDRSKTPLHPVRPRKKLNLLVSMLLGLVLGIGLAFLLEYLDNTLKGPEDVEKFSGLPSLGLVPRILPKELSTPYRDKALLPAKAGKESALTASQIAFITHSNPKSLLSEAFRTIRTAILLSFPDNPPKTFVITSPNPEEGKTTCAVNIAIALAQTGKKVLLVDADLRRPSLHRVFSKKGINFGLSGFLANITHKKKQESLAFPSAIENLSVVYSGPVPPDPTTLFSSDRLVTLIDTLGDEFDNIIFDCCPTLGFADVGIISRALDGILMVVAAGKTPKESLRQAKNQLERTTRTRVMGVAINGIDTRRDGYGYGYYYHRYNYFDGDTT